MSVRQSLLAILDQGPCYGYQLRAEFARRTGAAWPLNVGQIYNTLDRLERDGLVARGETDAHGHVFWTITPAGSREVAAWLASPVERATGTRDELAVKLALAATLPGVDAARVIDTQRQASAARLASLRDARAAAADEVEVSPIAQSLLADAMVYSAEAEVRWLDHAATIVAQHPAASRSLPLATERPRRGRPTAAA